MMSDWRKPQIGPATLVLRIGLAAVFITHGYFKVFMDVSLIPEVTLQQQHAIGWTEIVCGGLLLLGLLSRLAALVMLAFQAGAIALVTGGQTVAGLSVTKVGANYSRVGPEFNVVLICMCLAVILLGSGWASTDHCLWRRRVPPMAG